LGVNDLSSGSSHVCHSDLSLNNLPSYGESSNVTPRNSGRALCKMNRTTPVAEQAGFGISDETTPKWSGRRDIRMICQAVLNGWKIPDPEKPEILAHLRAVLADGKGRNLFRVQAAIAKLESDIRATPIVASSTE
jgi:hypothetical protein